MQMFGNKTFFIILFITAAGLNLSAQEAGPSADAPVKSVSDGYSTSVFMGYNIRRSDYARIAFYI